VTRLGFADRIHGARVLAVRVGLPLRWPLGCDPQGLVGQHVGMVMRRGKYLWLPLSQGGLLLHLGMSGSLLFGDQPPAPGGHDHFDLVTTHGCLRLTDPRRFGAVVWSRSLESLPAAKLLARLGLEPFDPALTGAYVHSALQGRRVSIKQVLLAGNIVVGAGNIYACEALFRSAIDPRLPSNQLTLAQATRLVHAIQAVLSQAIALGGSSLRDFRNAHGLLGAFQQHAQVYGRAGEPCKICTQPIVKMVQGQRSTFFCGFCQSTELVRCKKR
jgi:formamidopyrimidine-DNA glycosylase